MLDNNALRRLENEAFAAHRAGRLWSEFWAEHGPQVREAERELRERLMHIVCTGERSGQFAAGDPDAIENLVEDDGAKPDDTHTNARYVPPAQHA